jgi:hypothetical protein
MAAPFWKDDVMTKLVYDQNRNDIVDCAEKLDDGMGNVITPADILALEDGLHVKDPVDTTTFGVGDITLSGEQTLNGLLTSASRVLVTDQTLPEENGIYITAAGAWARAADFDEDSEVSNGSITHCLNSGSTSFKNKYILTTADPITVGVTGQSWSEHPDAVPAHASNHQHGGSDEIATATPAANAIPKADGSGLLDSWVTPGAGAHAATHQNGGSDEINVGGLSGLLADAQTPAAHTHTHASTTGQGTDDHHPKLHAADHTNGTDDIQNATAAQKGLATATQITKLDGIETGATADQTDAEIETAYQTQVPLISQGDAEAGTATDIESWSALRVAQAIAALADGGTDDAEIATTDATLTTIETVALVDNTAYFFEVHGIARQTAAGPDNAAFVRRGVFYREGGGAVQVGSDDTPFSEGNSNFQLTFAVSGNNVLVQVQGVAATNISWRTERRTTQMASV